MKLPAYGWVIVRKSDGLVEEDGIHWPVGDVRVFTTRRKVMRLLAARREWGHDTAEDRVVRVRLVEVPE